MSKRASKAKRSPAPERIWLEQWPEAAQRDDAVHYEQTGYGDDLRGNTSGITVYVRDREQQSRLDAIAAITSLRALTLAVSGDYLRAIHVLAAGVPKRECQAAIKRWSKPNPDHEAERIKLEMHKSAKGAAELGQALNRTGRRL